MKRASWGEIARRTRLPWATIERQQKRVQETQLARENAKRTAADEIAAIAPLRALRPGMSDMEVREIAKRRADMMPARMNDIGECGRDIFIKRLNAILVELDARPFPAKCKPERLGGIISRVSCADWWGGQLKRAVVRLREKQGRASGEVCARRQQYVTHDTVRRMLNRDAAARAMLEATEIESEDGEVINLAQAADAGTAKLSIRRGELMTRIKGCEEWSDIAEWEGLFTTNTAPSRFHAVTHTGTINPNWIAAGKPTPKDGQAWLTNTWAKCRAKLGRLGIMVMGFRVAEPHQDGTPHWHMLVWCKPGMWAAVAAIMAEYWLEDSGDEPGAQQHRFNCKYMEAGGAAGYIAKYISKGIDDEGEVGFSGHVDDLPDGRRMVMEQGDMFGGGATRVRMWARAHGIKQFQPLGQPPVTVWRELRRVELGGLEGATQVMQECWEAVNRDGERRANWLVYLERQGGACIGRNYRIRVATEDREHHGRYETETKPFPIGVVDLFDEELTIVASSRKEWRPRGAWGQRVSGPVQTRAPAMADAGRDRAGAVHPWTRVNNCTGEVPQHLKSLVQILGDTVCRTPKVGKVFRWKQGEGQMKGPG